jgi:glycosyltransferase involved in cell wall biosynthesis
VLTAHARAYESVLAANESMIPANVSVVRAPAWDTARHLSVGGRYLRTMALPDRWQSWIPGAIVAGLRTIRRDRPDALFSTFPIASAHLIGLALHRISGLPWIADLRDPMYQDNYPTDPAMRRSYRWIEEQVFRSASRITVTTPGTADYYRQRYGPPAAEKLRVIANGFDPESFPRDFPNSQPARDQSAGRRLLLLHSGVLYPRERNPEPLLRALARLRESGDERLRSVDIVFRGSVYEDSHRALIERLGLADVVRLEPALPYGAALQEMLTADALLVMQADNCNSQIPAKLYEYFYTGRPIIGLADPRGDTGQLLRRMGVDTVAPLESEAAIGNLLRTAIRRLRDGTFAVPSREEVLKLSRRARTAELAELLNEASLPARTAAQATTPR